MERRQQLGGIGCFLPRAARPLPPTTTLPPLHRDNARLGTTSLLKHFLSYPNQRHPRPDCFSAMTEVYPSEYIAHDCPFILVSGLGDPKSWAETPRYPELENGANIESTLPPVTIPEGESLLQAFLASDVAGIWPPKNDKPIKGSVVPFFKVKAVGRVCMQLLPYLS